ncbi:MAG: class I tRNA ligase family protein [candidate division SR1 bacterium]|nr:class I tRNA ligase family protein [candidate division SR1 bacterium]
MPEIKKKYNHFSIESELLKKNYFQKLFTTKKNTVKRETVITQLPITITKDTSLASISGLIKEDVIATYQIMKGIKSKLLPIFDTEEKNIKTENYENLLTKAGIFFSIDTDNIVYSERNTNFVRNLFVELVEDGHIYEDCSINHRSLQEQKTLGTDEIQYKKMQVKEYNLRYFVDTKNISLIVPTIWPETLFADVALAVHPDDKRYKKLIKNKVIIPIINRTIPIIGDESIDPTKGTGIMRITPAHDKHSLIIAQKNDLKIDNFAIDKNGCFTKSAGDFCGKNASEFIKNIVKNLDDIHNLESTKYIETEIAVHRKTNERARPLLCNQLFIKTDKELENIQTAIQEKKLTITPEYYEENIADVISKMEYWPVTKEDSKGYSLPLWKNKSGKNYFISDNEILNLPVKKTKNKFTVLSLIIFNLIVDRRMKQEFSIEECIDILLGKSRTGEQNTLEAYIELFNETLPRGYSKEINELKKIIEYTEKDINSKKGKGIGHFEKFSITLTNFLEKSIAISSNRKGFYSFDIDTLVPNDTGLIQQKEKIEETLGHALILIKMMEAFDDSKKQPQKIFCINENKVFEFLKTIIIGYNVQNKMLFDTCYIQKEQKTNKKNKETFKELIKNFGTDCTRLYAIDPDKDITEYDNFISKLRNASRFVGQHIYEKKGTRKIADFEQLTTYLEKRKNELSEFELWIIYKTIELQKEYEDAMAKNALPEIQEKIITLIKDDFCDKYLEIQKHQDTENGNKVTLWCLGTLLKLLHPFIPFISQQIRELLGLDGPVLAQEIQEQFTTISKNYKTQLFMDIIDKFLNMKQKYEYAKHEEIEICFFAPLDFLQYLRKQEKIIYKLINASSIEYLENEKELEKYHIESIINITIGIKIERKKTVVTNKKEDIRESLREKEQELQSMRTMMPSLSSSGADPEVIRGKKKEMTKLKKDIEELQYQLQKEKANK